MNDTKLLLLHFAQASLGIWLLIYLLRKTERTIVLGEPPGQVSYPYLYWCGLLGSALWTLLMGFEGVRRLVG